MNRRLKFGENIKILREQNNLSQEELAAKIPVTRQTVSNWEKNVSAPDIYILTILCEMFNLSADQILYQRLSDERYSSICSYYEEQEGLIRQLNKKGFYDITEADIEDFFPIISMSFAIIMGLAVNLKELGYNVLAVYSNGFSIYFNTDMEAVSFGQALFDLIESIIHHEPEYKVITIAENVQEKINEVESDVIDETNSILYGFDVTKAFYWQDDLMRIRGFGKNKIECEEQAKRQGCTKYEILKL